MDVERLNNLHIDVLREIGSIGSGNAVTSMAQMLGYKIEMTVPKVNLVDFKDISNFIGGGENLIVGILVHISGDINGMMMFIVEEESASQLLEVIMGGMSAPGPSVAGRFSEMQLSALQEIGNILTSSYLSALGSMINKMIIPSVPYLSIDMANAILSVPAIEFGKVSDKVLFIESVFANKPETVSGYFLLIPDFESFEVILTSLGVGINDK